MPMSFHLCEEPIVEPLAPTVPPLLEAWDPSKPIEPRKKVKVPLKNFSLDDKQLATIKKIYMDGLELRLSFGTSTEAQARANTFLREKDLTAASLEQLESRWNVSWSNGWSVGNDYRKRTRYQCNCGYNSAARQQKSNSAGEKEWVRHAPYDFTGCCVHADITYVTSGNKCLVERVIGYFTHNEECKAERLKRMPAIPLHEHVYEVALSQLAQGCSVATIQKENMHQIEHKLYRDQSTVDRTTTNIRYELLPGDFSRLHRRYYREQGINIQAAPEINVDNWLNTESPQYEADIAEAVFHYGARADKGERFEIFIATPEMNKAAWKHVHQKQLILDGTFGVCTSRLLLWIAMGVDENGNGVPVAMFLFSAPTGAKATHAGYDTKIIAKLLKSWKESMSRADGEVFTPFVAITDSDTKERGALIQTWPKITLLLCKFHIKQCWKNKREGLLGKKDSDFCRSHVNDRLRAFEERMLQTTDYTHALGDLAAERNVMTALAEDSQTKKSGSYGIEFLAYFESTWFSRDMWASWSRKGRNDAAAVLGINIEGVLPTTNHLESFNGVLKRKHLGQWQRGGRKLRFDVLIHRLVLQILPFIYGQYRVLNSFYSWKSERFQHAAGGVMIPSQSPRKRTTQQNLPPLTWYQADSRRDGFAQDFVKLNRVASIQSGRKYELWGTCAATGANIRDPVHPRYWMTVHPSGSATCTCMDWLTRGGACKHLRAFRLLIEAWSRQGHLAVQYYFPRSREEALHIDTLNRHWYGDHFSDAITAAVQNTNVLEPLVAPPQTFKIIKKTVPLPPRNVNIKAPSLEQEAEWEEQILEMENNIEIDPDSSSDMKTYWSNSRAIELQVQQRFQQYINQTLPILHGIENLLDDSTPALTTLNLDEFTSILDLLSTRLKAARLSSPVNNGTSSLADNVVEAPTAAKASNATKTKVSEKLAVCAPNRRKRALLPPSPERKQQKRHKSYSTL